MMPKKRSLSILLLLAALIALVMSCSFSAAQAPKKVRVGYFIHNGYQNKAADGSYSGYGYDYLQKIAGYAGFQYEFVEGSWAECLKRLRDGKIDMLGFMLKTKEREAVYDFPIWNCGYNSTKLLTLKNNTTFAENAWGEFNGIRVGFLHNSQTIRQFIETAHEHGFKYTQKLYNTEEEVTGALKRGDVDAICVSNVVIPKEVRVLSTFDPQPIYYAVAKGNTGLINDLNSAIGKIKMLDPTFDQSLRAKYYNDEGSQTVVFSQAEKAFIAKSKPISVAIDPDFLPIEGFDSRTGQAAGFTAALLSKVSQMSGLQFTFLKNDNYASAIRNFSKGDYDILSGVNQSFFGSGSLVFSDKWLEASIVTVGTNTFLTEARHPLKIAVTPRTNFLKKYTKTLYPDCQLVPFDTVPESLAALDSHEVDLALVNIYSFQTLTFLVNQKLKIIQDTGYYSEYRFAYHEKAPKELVSIINKCINSISESDNNNMLAAAISSSMEIKNDGWKTFIISTAALLMLAAAVFLFTRLRKSRKSLIQLAYYDQLTGAGNLAKFTMDAKELLHQNPKLQYTIRVFDISNFQMFNDFYGFEEGNVLLCGVVNTLKGILDAKTETLGRVNADEFISLTTDVAHEAFAARAGIFRARFFSGTGRQEYHRVAFKTGCYVLETGSEDVAEAIEKAMLAHKAAKLSGKQYVYYDENMKIDAQRVREIERNMYAALANREFKLYLQPQYRISDSSIMGMEALVRWQPKDGPMIFPNAFIPIFEKNGFIVKLDYYMFEQTCKTIRSWIDSGIAVTIVSVNLSRLHLENTNLVAELCGIADQYHVPHGLLELELTETVAMENEELLYSTTKQFHDAGMRLSVDDFGSGYSSLGILNYLSFDTLKLDRSFFKDTHDMERSQVIIRSIIQMAQDLNITTIAEGIEEAGQVDFLRKIHCDAIQGYYYAKPMPAADATRLLSESSRKKSPH